MTRMVPISDLLFNDMEPRSWEWRFSHLIDMDNFDEDRFKCTPDRFPFSRIMHTESIRLQNFKKAMDRIQAKDWDEVRQFRAIIIDEYGMVISGMKVLQIHKMAGQKCVEVSQIFGLKLWEKLEFMLADSDNFEQFNWEPKLPRMTHKKVPDFKYN